MQVGHAQDIYSAVTDDESALINMSDWRLLERSAVVSSLRPPSIICSRCHISAVSTTRDLSLRKLRNEFYVIHGG